MNLSPNSWHVKTYMFATDLFELWKSPTFPREYEGGSIDTNLCPYMRRLLVTLPLLLVFYASVVWFAGYTMIYWPATHLGWPYFRTILLAIAAIVAVISFILLMFWLCPRLGPTIWKYIGEPLGQFFGLVGEKIGDCVLGSPEAPSFCTILRQWIIDRHHMVCRPITIGAKEMT